MSGEAVSDVSGKDGPERQSQRRSWEEAIRARLANPGNTCCRLFLLSDEMLAQMEAFHQRFREEHPEAATLLEPIQLDERVKAQIRAKMRRRFDEWGY